MRSLRFLVTRRWITFFLVVVALAALAWRLGVWQFHRLDDRRASNAVIERNEGLAPAPVADELAVGRQVSEEQEWRKVTATGVYEPDDTIVVRYQTRDGEPGVDVVVPLHTTDGPTLIVNRGWMASENRGADVEDIPAPPSGEVTVTGWLRADAPDATSVSENSVRAISSEAIGAYLDEETYGGFVELDTESPAPATPLAGVELPELNEGPHFFYGLQWWFFALLALVGFFWLAYEEWTGKAAERRRHAEKKAVAGTTGRSDRAEHAAVDRNHDSGQEA